MSKFAMNCSKITLFFALSRIKHAVLDIATPAFCAMLWLGGLPAYNVIAVGLIAAFAGYTAVYALNDLIGYRADKQKFIVGQQYVSYSVESTSFHHPIAQNLLSVRDATLWVISWLLIALISSYYLNPVIVLILLVATFLEITYCLLLNITYFRTIISGIVKSCGPVAAVFALDSSPNLNSLFMLFGWVFLWEIGGQNIPADWSDKNSDQRAKACTLPIYFGADKTSIMVLCVTFFVTCLGGLLFIISPVNLGMTYIVLSLIAGYLQLIKPAYTLYCSKNERDATRLFDKASYYPLTLLFIILFIYLMRYY